MEPVDIKPWQQMTASCSGAILTSLMGKLVFFLWLLVINKFRIQNFSRFVNPDDCFRVASCLEVIFLFCCLVTPLDVVKIRLQKQVKQKSGAQCNGGGRYVERNNFYSCWQSYKSFCSLTAKKLGTSRRSSKQCAIL